MTVENTLSETRPGDLPALVRLSLGLKSLVEFVGKGASFLLVPLVLVTMWDVTARKLVWVQLWLVEHFGRVFESTFLQELEWHFHTALFTLVLGYGYVYNRHVRVDLVRETLTLRTQAIIEFIGCTFFMIPYTLIVIYFAYIFATDSYAINEISASQVGLSHRWIIKSIMLVGLIFAALSGIAVWLQTVIVLFGSKEVRFHLMTLQWPDQEVDRRISTKTAD